VSAWPQVRAAILCLVVAGNLLYAVPFPRKSVDDDDRETWREGDIDMWYGWLSGAGLPWSRQRFGELVVDANNRLHDLGRWVHSPVRPVFRTLRTTQQWGLFGIVAEAPEALVVEIEVDGQWTEIERRLHPDRDWRDEVFKYRRVRGTWDSAREDKPSPLYDSFCRWTAQLAFADHPAAQRVRVSRHRHFVLAPWETEELEPKRVNERTFTRGQASLWAVR